VNAAPACTRPAAGGALRCPDFAPADRSQWCPACRDAAALVDLVRWAEAFPTAPVDEPAARWSFAAVAQATAN
jgi:hypothetical protein